MPIDIKGKVVVKAKNKTVEPKPAVAEQSIPVEQRQQPRRTKLKKIPRQHKFRTEEEYEQIKLLVDGEEKKVSNASKYLLDMLIVDDK